MIEFNTSGKSGGAIYIDGANATVNKSFNESNVVVAGTPAKIVKTNVPSWNKV